MAYRSKTEELCGAVVDAKEGVARAQFSYQRGGSPDAVNRANRKLADAHDAWQTFRDGRVPDNRN